LEFNVPFQHKYGYIRDDIKQEKMIEWQWHQLDRMQIIRTSLQSDNHVSS